MNKAFWLLFALAAGLALFSARPTGSVCDACTQGLSFPDFSLPMTAAAASPMTLPPYPAPPSPEDWHLLRGGERVSNARQRLLAPMKAELKSRSLRLGAPVFIRVFKDTRELELWMKSAKGWQLFRRYPVAAMSGSLGPKLREGDGQAPEGFYSVTRQSMNPDSTFHLSFNIGYPNAYDRHHGRTGSFIMVHGNEVSIGCFAMTDPVVEEIYLLVDAALTAGQAEVPVHTFPFPLTEERLTQNAGHESAAFWRELQPGFSAFEKNNHPPRVSVENGRYKVRP